MSLFLFLWVSVLPGWHKKTAILVAALCSVYSSISPDWITRVLFSHPSLQAHFYYADPFAIGWGFYLCNFRVSKFRYFLVPAIGIKILWRWLLNSKIYKQETQRGGRWVLWLGYRRWAAYPGLSYRATTTLYYQLPCQTVF